MAYQAHTKVLTEKILTNKVIGKIERLTANSRLAKWRI
jgi:hypothetical protein